MAKTYVLVDGYFFNEAVAAREFAAYRERQRRHDAIVWLLNQERPVKEISSDYVVTVWAKDCYL